MTLAVYTLFLCGGKRARRIVNDGFTVFWSAVINTRSTN